VVRFALFYLPAEMWDTSSIGNWSWVMPSSILEGDEKSTLPRGPRYRGRTFAVIGMRGHAEGALHSRTTENSIAAAKKAKTRVRERIIIVYHDA